MRTVEGIASLPASDNRLHLQSEAEARKVAGLLICETFGFNGLNREVTNHPLSWYTFLFFKEVNEPF